MKCVVVSVGLVGKMWTPGLALRATTVSIELREVIEESINGSDLIGASRPQSTARRPGETPMGMRGPASPLQAHPASLQSFDPATGRGLPTDYGSRATKRSASDLLHKRIWR